MNDANRTHDQQSALWNGAAGHAWVDAQETLDRMFQPFEDLLVDSVSAGRILDVGCGAGAVTLRLGARCVGIDISQPLVDAARARAAREASSATFLLADAQRYPSSPLASTLSFPASASCSSTTPSAPSGTSALPPGKMPASTSSPGAVPRKTRS